MRSGLDCAPRRCVCGRKLDKPIYGSTVPYGEKRLHIRCSCSMLYLWSFHPASNGCWKLRHELPLFDEKRVMVIA